MYEKFVITRKSRRDKLSGWIPNVNSCSGGFQVKKKVTVVQVN
jgi:hypothetical protein